ncbi:FAD-dependent monooxygenase [Nocardia higoensis]|uniref:FAD-dependent monooxygenase n=1 Tax=Nocardia higoensis TaxID=228599 RepID=UPI0002ED5CEE|nr:FAD-dependent monooxygenase [Nocardia higoensis]
MSDERGRAGVIGGGIAGLGSAIALRAAGWDVTVYEQAQRFTEVGAAIFLAENALRAMDVLGVGDRVREYAVGSRPCTVRNERGRVLIEAHLDDFVGNLVAIHRADLIAILQAAVPPDCVRLGARVEYVDAEGWVRTSSGEASRYDLVVAADGVHSRVRQLLWPRSGPARTTRITSWRWILDTPASEGIGFVWGTGAECGVIPMAGDRTVVYAAARDGFASLEYFSDWPDPVPALIAAGRDRMVCHELLEVAVPRRLWHGRVALVGDAGHAMIPTLGQGACQALEDAVVLAGYAPDLRRYSVARRNRTVVMGALARHGMLLTGPHSAAVAALRDTVLSATPDAVTLRLLRLGSARAIGRWRPPIEGSGRSFR